MDRRRAAGALLALAACIACSSAAPTANDQTALELREGPSEGCYYNFQHYGEGDRIMTNEPCLNCTCHNRMLMCYLKVCPFTKPIGQDCTIEKRADQCCPIVTCPDVPVDLLTSTSTSSPAEYGATGLGKVDKYGCSIHGKYFPEGSKVPPTPNKPCEHCYCIRNMTTCVMQECTLHVDGCTPIYNKDVCCPVRYSCDHLEDEMLLLDDMTTTVRPTPGFLLTTTTMPSVTQASQNCVHDDQIFADGALIKTEIACEHCYCMKGDIVCVVQECGTPMENEGKNCTSLPPREGQCCPDTYICEGDELLSEPTTGVIYEELTTLSPPRRVEGSGYRNEPDEPYTEIPFEGSGEEQATTLDSSDMFTSQKQTPQIIDEIFAATEESFKPSLTTIEPDKEQNTVPDDSHETISDSELLGKTTIAQEATTSQPTTIETIKETDTVQSKTTVSDYHPSSEIDNDVSKDDEFIMTTESESQQAQDESNKMPEVKPEIETETSDSFNVMDVMTTQQTYIEQSSPKASTGYVQEDKTTTEVMSKLDEISQPVGTTLETPKDDSEVDHKQDVPVTDDKDLTEYLETTTVSRIESSETTSINPVENEIVEDVLPPGRIPGEGDCLLDGVTYNNNTNVPNINNCHSSCKCISSIVKCDPIICSPPPEQMDNMSDCQPIYDTPDACCPTYVCHSRETIPPESHSQMSGTESPKTSPESECHGEKCEPHKANEPISPELCNSESCKPTIQDQEKECSDGVCENTETNVTTSPVQHREPCSGDSCLPSAESCPDGQCKPLGAGEIICNNENGCQSSEACNGNNCVVSTDVTVPTNELPICKDSEGCKVTYDTSSCDGANCDTPQIGTQPVPGTIDQSECTENSCRRKEQPQDNKSPSECSGSDCIIQGAEAEPSFTTESTVKDQTYKEPIGDDYSKSPESDETPLVETEKVTQVEVTTKYHETAPERSTEESKDSSAEDSSEIVTSKQETYTGTSIEMEGTVTEIYNKQETEDYQTILPEIQTTKSKEQATESGEHIPKESTEYPFATQYEEHSTELPKEDMSSVSTKSFETSTKTLDIEPQDQEKNKDDVTDTSITEEFTEMHETSTKSTNIQETTFKELESAVTEQELTKEQEMVTQSLEEYSTRLEEAMPSITEKQEPTKSSTPDSIITESLTDVSVTEPSLVLVPETSTEKQIDIKIKGDDNDTSTEVFDGINNIPEQFTTEQTSKVQQPSEPDETATNKIYDETVKDHIPTEKPIALTDATKIEAEYQQTTEMGASLSVGDTEKITTDSPFKDQVNVGPTEMFDTATDKQDTYPITKETQDYVTSDDSAMHTTQPPSTEDNLVTHMDETSSTQTDEPKLPEYTIKESPPSTVSQEPDEKEITTQQPEIIEANVQELTTKTTDIQDTPLGTKDLTEVSTITPEKTLQEVTTPKESLIIEPVDNEVEDTSKTILTTGLDTTISSVVFDKDEETSTRHTETEPDMEHSGETTAMPEVDLTKSDESISVSAETEKGILETSTSNQVEAEVITTESLKEPQEDKTEMPEYIHTSNQSQEPSIKESTLSPMVPYTDVHADSDDKIISVATDKSKTQEELGYTTPGTVKEVTEKQDTMSTDDSVTKVIKEDKTVTDFSVKHHDAVTNALESTTQSQDAITKLATELHTDQEIFTTPVHIIKEEKGQTESPMSLVTEVSEGSMVAKTTQVPELNVLNEEEVKIPDNNDIEPQIPYTESPQSENKLEPETPSQSYSEKETLPEVPFTSPLPEYTTVRVLDIHDVEKTSITEIVDSGMSTKMEDLAPTTEKQEATVFVQKPVDTYTESDETYVSHEPTSVPSVISTEGQEIPTIHPDILDSVTTAIYDHQQDTKPEDMLEKEHILEPVTDEPQNRIDSTTLDSSKTTASLGEEYHEDIQKDKDITINVVDSKPATSSELYTTNYPETLDDSYNKQTVGYDLSKDVATEGVITEQPIYPDAEIQSSIDQDRDKSTAAFDTSDKKDVTTQTYEELTTLKQQSMADVPESQYTTGVVTTESSEISPSEENIRHTLSPIFVSIETEQQTTEKQIVTESPEIAATQDIEQTDKSQEMSTKASEEERITSVTSDKEFDHVTSIPQATESNIALQTETVSSDLDLKLSTITETTEKHTEDEHGITVKPDTEIGFGEDLQTKSPVTVLTEKYEIPVKETDQSDVTKVPEEVTPVEIPSEHTVAQELPTEGSVPKETEISKPVETEAQTPLETETEISVPVDTEILVPETTETSGLKETEIIIPKVTEPSTPKDEHATVSNIAEITVMDVTEVSGLKEAEVTSPEEAEASVPAGTESSVPAGTESSVHKGTEDSVPETTESTETTDSESSKSKAPEIVDISTPKVTESFVTEETKTYVPEETEVSAPVATESSVPEVTQGALSEETKASASEFTIDESSGHKATEASVPEMTESTVSVSDASIPKETESESINKESEAYTPKDEKSEVPVEHSTTLEPIHISSETTPYLVELQEHTTKEDEDVSSVPLAEEDRTRAPETYQTERGDQPLDNLPDKFTPVVFNEEPATEVTFTKNEQLSTLSPEQAGELDKIPDKVDVATEEDLAPESPMPTLSDTHIGLQTTSSGEHSVTISPTVSMPPREQETVTSALFEVETTTGKKDLPMDLEKAPEHEIMHETTGSEEVLIPTVTKATTISTPEEVAAELPVADDKFNKPEEKPSESYTPTAAAEVPKPGINEVQPTEEIPAPDFPSGSSGYGQEPDYVEEDQAFGPGTCRYGGKVYVSAQQIPRDDPCDFCFCFRSDIICLQQSCPPPIHGCHEEPIQGFCCPRYECPVSMATTLNVTTTTTTTTTTLPPHFLPHAYKGAAQRRGCQIKGHSYKVGEVVRASSGPCLHCTCGGDGQMKCDPKACTPEPMLRQMIAAAVSAKRRR